MNKIWLILQREYLTRVRKKSFLVISLLAPLLLAATTIGVGKFNSASGPDTVAVHDESGLNLAAHLQDTDEIRFVPAAPGALPTALAAFQKAKPKQAALLNFPAGFGSHLVSNALVLPFQAGGLKQIHLPGNATHKTPYSLIRIVPVCPGAIGKWLVQ
ncbi:MAG: hypothetical protein EOO56_14910 [Hymenobacter sp.]|nr:MAG: hypothetical protein EOO56_14910 [Hymenobacter sp.]